MSETVVGILSPGEMGSQIAQRLGAAGIRVATVIEGRSDVTAERARQAGMVRLKSLDRLVTTADLLLSVVPPAAAKPLAREVADAVARTRAPILYVDANAISPQTVGEIASLLTAAGAQFVDASIIGKASDWESGTRLYVSGEAAPAVSQRLGSVLRVDELGPTPGQASGLKMLYAGLTKGLSALGMELMAGAQALHLSDRLIPLYGEHFPDVIAFWESTLPGLPARSRRRAQEMKELAGLLGQLSIPAVLAAATEDALDRMADRHAIPSEGDPRTLAEVAAWWVRQNAPDTPPTSSSSTE